jgi:hypothetical protein
MCIHHTYKYLYIHHVYIVYICGQYAGIISGHVTGGALLICAILRAGKSDGQAATQPPMKCNQDVIKQ